jgi:hypothetical protein
MRLNEIFDIEEGGASGGARYNSEVAFLYALAARSELDPAQPSKSFKPGKFADSKRVLAEIDRFLVPNYDEKKFQTWLTISEKYIAAIENHQGKKIGKLGWAGGSNINDDGVADVVFVEYPAAGVSIKDTGGITLSNLTPKSIGLEPPRGTDVFAHLARSEFDDMKTKIFKDVLADAKRTPDVEQNYGGTRGITYNSETKDFTVRGKKQTITATAKDIMAQVGNNANWQRVFGDWFQLNWATKKKYAAPLYSKVAKMIEASIEKQLSNSESLHRALQIADVPYYYATTKSLYYVPPSSDAGDLALKQIYYAEPDGTSQKFVAEIGHPDNPKNARVTIYIRYANGMFESSPTVRVQDLKNPENILWEKII